MALWIFSLLVWAYGVLAAEGQDFCKSSDPFATQLQCYRQTHQVQSKKLTLSTGAPFETKYLNSLNRGLIKNPVFVDTFLSSLSQTIPNRIVHAAGTGAYGYFEVTNHFSYICNAKLFSEVGKRTPVVVRFSLNSGIKGLADTSRNGRGMAVRFDTEDGFFSLTSLNMPVFFIKDPVKFSTFLAATGKNPTTNADDPNMLWDFVLSAPESLFSLVFTLTDLASPNGYDRMKSYGIHTYQLENNKGKPLFVRFHWIPDSGVENLNITQANAISLSDPDYLSRKLYNQIASGNYPSWSLYAQVLSKNDVSKAKRRGLDVFDITRILFEDEYRLRKVGKLVLNRNIKNHFAEMEQLAIGPFQLVPHILGAPDKIFESRMLGYRLAHNHRLGVNFHKTLFNQPKQSEVYTYNRHGHAPVGDNGADAPGYYPNTFNGPKAVDDIEKTKLYKVIQDAAPQNFGDLKRYYEEIFTDNDRKLISSTIALSLSGTADDIRDRVFDLIQGISSKFGSDVTNEYKLATSS